MMCRVSKNEDGSAEFVISRGPGFTENLTVDQPPQ
jgi:hypothetical protein